MTVLSIAPAAPCDGPEISELLHRSYMALLAAAYKPKVLAAALPAITQARPGLLACPIYFVARRSGCIVGVGAGPM